MSNVLDIIGENFNTSRRIKATSPRVVKDGDLVKLSYVNLKGETDFLDVTSIYPKDPDQVKKTQLTHVAQAMHTKNMDYIEWVILRQIEAGANIIDIGGESTRPGSQSINSKQEWQRIENVLKNINKKITLSLDTRKSDIMKKGINNGVKLINDISGLSYDKQTIGVLKKTLEKKGLIKISNFEKNQNKLRKSAGPRTYR